MKHMRNIVFILVIIGMAISFFACNKNKKEKKEEKSIGAIAFKVKTEKAKISDISEYLSYSGVVKSYSIEIIMPEVAGRITNLYKEVGDSVKKGELLLRIEDTMYKARYNQAKAAISSAKTALKDAKRNKIRIENLYKKDGVSEIRYEKAVTAYEMAINNFKRAKAAYEMAEFQYNSIKVYASFDGIITAKRKEEGDFINPSMSSASPKAGVYTLENYDKIYVDTEIPFSRINLFKKSQVVEIIFDHKRIEGKILTVSDKGDPMSASFPVRIIVNNKEKLILPGIIVRVSIHYNFKSNALTIPVSGLVEGNRVFVASGNRALEKSVKIGLKNPKIVEILSGIKEGDNVIIEGNFGLFQNAIIKEEKE